MSSILAGPRYRVEADMESNWLGGGGLEFCFGLNVSTSRAWLAGPRWDWTGLGSRGVKYVPRTMVASATRQEDAR